MRLRLKNLVLDPRNYQIAVLASLLLYGLTALNFDITWSRVGLTFACVLLVQAIASKWAGVPKVEFRSALISGLSLCLLLRANSLWLIIAACVVTIGSKFVVRFQGKHIFNPTNIGLVAIMLLSDHAWVSPGQWGSLAFFAFLTACLGGLVVTRARRADISLGFLAVYCSLVIGRSLWLNEPLAIPFHRLQSGALLIFTFFMISDPKTTPDSRAGRLIFASLVAFGAWYWQFRLFHINGLLYALAAFAPLTPLIDRWLPGPRYAWNTAPNPQRKENENEKSNAMRNLAPVPAS